LFKLMPELPEVETIRLQLKDKLRGLLITEVKVLNVKSFIGEASLILGKKVESVDRRAKIILIKLTNDKCLAIHLKLTGQLIFRDKRYAIGDKKNEEKDGPFAVGQLPNKFTRAMICFGDGSFLYFNDLRKFGWIKVLSAKNCGELPELKKLGPEAIDKKTFSLEYFTNILSRSRKPVKLVIMDQEKLAGVGNIYANEALFRAGVRPDRPANSLNSTEIEKLRNSIINILTEAIKQKGTSDKDEAYRQISGEKGKFQNLLQVYGRTGQKCPRCGGTIRRIALGGRGTFYCPNCQK